MRENSMVTAFLESETTTNQKFLAERLILGMSDSQFASFAKGIKQLNELAYKSWAKDLTINDLVEIVGTIEELYSKKVKEKTE